MHIKPCKWRGKLTIDKYACATPRLIGHHDGVTADFCNTQCPYVDHEVNYKNSKVRQGVCVHMDEPTDRMVLCKTCNGHVDLKVIECGKHGECVRGRTTEGVQGCLDCVHYSPSTPCVDITSRTIRVNSVGLPVPSDQRAFNPSLLLYHGKCLMCYRSGSGRSTLHIALLGDDWRPISTTLLDLNHPRCDWGKEDPRLFVHQGRLHVQFAGVEIASGQMRVNMMYAVLDDDLVVVEVHEAAYPSRTPMEKNWGPFSHDDDLFAVYSILPHKVVKIGKGRGLDRPVEMFEETAGPARWLPDEVFRGGAAPVKVGDEYYSFFHSWHRTGQHSDHWYDYTIGVYTFDAWPPFRARRWAQGPILRGDRKEIGKNLTPDKNVIFPGGAVLLGGEWIVSYGHQDKWCELAFFPAWEIERILSSGSPSV